MVVVLTEVKSDKQTVSIAAHFTFQARNPDILLVISFIERNLDENLSVKLLSRSIDSKYAIFAPSALVNFFTVRWR